jgi:hypothetical protein
MFSSFFLSFLSLFFLSFFFLSSFLSLSALYRSSVLNLVCNSNPYCHISLKFISILSSHPYPGLPSGLLISGFLLKALNVVFHACYTSCSSILLQLIILVLSRRGYNLWSFPLLNSSQHALTWALLGPDVFLSTLSQTPWVWWFFLSYSKCSVFHYFATSLSRSLSLSWFPEYGLPAIWEVLVYLAGDFVCSPLTSLRCSDARRHDLGT